ncbi:MAG: glycerol kinase GlpK [Flavobacteriaceae bacterium]
MDKFILTLDQGTTSSRAIIVDKMGTCISTAQKEFTQIFPKPGWVEHDPQEIWSSQYDVILKAIMKTRLNPSNIAAIGIANQRETVVVWDRNTGKPVYNAVVWQDKRTSGYCNELKESPYGEMIFEKTGLYVDAYFSATKIKWILDNVANAREGANKGDLLFGTIDTWLVWNLSEKKHHITDVSNASRTLLFNIHTMKWDDELLELFTIPKSMLPEIKQSSEVYGYTHKDLFEISLPISGIAGDQQAALFGQMCTEPGMVKNTYGTGCLMLMNIGEKPIASKNNLLTTVAWKINDKTSYALEGSVFTGGAVVQWLRDSLKIIKTSTEVEKLANSVDSSDGVYFVPAFVGLGAPHWNQDARGAFFGLTRGSSDAHIARAALESIAYQVMDVLRAMEADSGIHIEELRVDGGAAVNEMLMQFQANVLNTVTVRPKIIETTAMGAAFFAGLAIGFWQSVEEIKEMWEVDRYFKPSDDIKKIKHHIDGWHNAINALNYWSKNEF